MAEEMAPPGTILVTNVTRIGDTLAATPVIALLHRHWPEASITVLGGQRRVEAIDNLPGVSRIGTISKRSAVFLGWLGGKPYDLALVYNYDEPLIWHALRVSRKVVAFRQRDPELNRRLFLCVSPEAYQTVHITEHFHRLPTALGLTGGDGRIRYQCRPQEVDAARSVLAHRGFSERRPLIGLQIASFPTKSYRDWPAESFLAVCRLILERWPKAGFLLYGGPDERPRTLWLQSQLGTCACHLAGELTLRQTAAAMSLTQLYIGVDTGPTHLMSAFDIPIIGLYHPRHPSVSLGPKDHPCNFSLDHPSSGDLDDQPRPMSEISVDTVFRQVELALACCGTN